MANLPEEVVMLKNSNMYLDCIYSITAQVKIMGAWKPWGIFSKLIRQIHSQIPVV